MCVTAHLCRGYLAQVGRVSGDFLRVIQESRNDWLESGGGLGQCVQDINGGPAHLLVWGAEAAQQGWHHWEAEHNTGVPRQCFCCTYNTVLLRTSNKNKTKAENAIFCNLIRKKHPRSTNETLPSKKELTGKKCKFPF